MAVEGREVLPVLIWDRAASHRGLGVGDASLLILGVVWEGCARHQPHRGNECPAQPVLVPSWAFLRLRTHEMFLLGICGAGRALAGASRCRLGRMEIGGGGSTIWPCCSALGFSPNDCC